MTAPGADLTAAGSVTGLGETPRVAADLTARIADLTPYSGLAGRPLEGSISLEAKGETGFDLKEAQVTLDATGDGLAIGLDKVDPLLDGQTRVALDLARSGDVLTINSARLDAADLDVTVTGVATGLRPSGSFDGRVSLAATDLSPFSALAGRDLSGGANLVTEGQVRFDASMFDMTLEVTATDLDPGLRGLDALLPGRTTLRADAARDADGVVTVEALTLDGQRVAAEVAGVLTGLEALMGPAKDASAPTPVPAFDGRASVRVDDLEPLSSLAGRALDGALQAEANGRTTFDASSFDLSLDAIATDVDPGFDGAAAALAGRVTLSAEASRDGETLEIRRLAVSGPSLRANVAGTMSQITTAPVFDGAADLEADDLSVFSELARRELGGSLTAELRGQAGADLSLLDLTAQARGPTSISV